MRARIGTTPPPHDAPTHLVTEWPPHGVHASRGRTLCGDGGAPIPSAGHWYADDRDLVTCPDCLEWIHA